MTLEELVQTKPTVSEAGTERDAIRNLLREFSWNDWFTKTFWPENEFRIRMTIKDVLQHKPPPATVLDIGCANGFMSYLFSQLGYTVTATDASDVPERPELFKRCNVTFFHSNLNELDPFPAQCTSSFDVALFGEVIEHILNHPSGLLKSIARTLKPDGLLVLSTPNPSTLMNAVRIVMGRHSLWGTSAFINEPKIRDGKIIDLGDVHYREYTISEIQDMLVTAGFEPRRPIYFSSGTARSQSKLKRTMKALPGVRSLGRTRVLGASQYFVAKKRETRSGESSDAG